MYSLVVTLALYDWWAAGSGFLGKNKLSTWEERSGGRVGQGADQPPILLVSFLDPQPSVASSYLCNWDTGQGELDQPSCVHLIMNPQGTCHPD